MVTIEQPTQITPPIFDILLTLKRLAVSDIVCITPIADLGEIAAEFKPDSTLAMVSAKLESTLCYVAIWLMVLAATF